MDNTDNENIYDFSERTEILIAKDSLLRLRQAKVLLFGVGGVGSMIAEALIRAGIGTLTIVDGDKIALSNINRQILALHSNVGEVKVTVMKDRLLDINPKANITALNIFYNEENAEILDFNEFDYIIDAIDTVKSKMLIINRAKEVAKPIISALGAGFKLDPALFRVADIYETSVCPLAKVMRKLCHEADIKELKCVYSTEKPHKAANINQENTIGSISFVPPAMGLIIASEVIKDLILG